ncbi:MAG: hypothetical protein ACXAC7_20845 [Candidatus Hodarchaeales archaeon]
MLKVIFLLNSRGLKVYSKILGKEKYLHDETSNFELIISTIYANLQENFPKEFEITEFKEIELPKGLQCYFYVHEFDLMVLFSSKALKSLPKDPIVNELLEKRQQSRSFYKGLCVADFDDTSGPIPIFNHSMLNESEQAMLSVQGTTVLGMGMTEMPVTLVGPVPVPTAPELSFLGFGYQRPAPKSEDPRILKGGRPATLFLIIDTAENIGKEVRDFVETFLFQWTQSNVGMQEKLLDDDLERLDDNIQQTITLAKDIISVRKSQEQNIRELLRIYASENLLLRDEIRSLKDQLQQLSTSKVKKVLKTKAKKVPTKKKKAKKVKKTKSRKKSKKK